MADPEPVMPLLGVWVEGRLYFCAGEGTRKARNLANNSTCVVTVEEEPLDETTLRRVADAYAAVCHGPRRRLP
jgi:hypothetical protein